MADRTRVYFGAFSADPDGSPISKVVGREPSTFKPIGEPIAARPGAVLRKRSVWTIESELPESASFQEHIEALLARLEVHADGVRKAVRMFDGCMNFYLWRETSTPGFHLTGEQIARVSALELPMDFDIYAFLPEED